MSATPPSAPDALLLCGGLGRRFGGDKGLAVVDGLPIIQRVIGALRPVAGCITLVTDREERYPDLALPRLLDAVPHRGPLQALAGALDRVEGELVFVASCDMPFLVPGLFALELSRLGDADACFPWDEQECSPLAALYRRRAAAAEARRALAHGEHRMMDLLARLRVSRLRRDDLRDLPPALLANVNSQEDLAPAPGTGAAR